MSSSNTRFPQPVIRECSRINPSPLVGVLGSDVRGGFMLVSSASERRWHVIDFLQKCMFGVVLRAVEVARSPHSGEWTPQAGRGYFAIKVSGRVLVGHPFVDPSSSKEYNVKQTSYSRMSICQVRIFCEFFGNSLCVVGKNNSEILALGRVCVAWQWRTRTGV